MNHLVLKASMNYTYTSSHRDYVHKVVHEYMYMNNEKKHILYNV